MNKKHTYCVPRSRSKIGPSPLAGRMLMTGLPIILSGCLDLAARLCDGLRAGEVGLFLRWGDACLDILIALAILLGGALLMEHWEQRDRNL